MKGKERRKYILQILNEHTVPVTASEFAKRLGVSRQVIVQDVALLRTAGHTIYSTSRGYIREIRTLARRVFKVRHTDDQVRDELNTIVDLGGSVEDVFVYHRVYGVVRGPLSIHSRFDIDKFVGDIESGKSHLLMNVTSGYHYHTVTAPSEEILDLIQKKLDEKGFLAPLQDYEPVKFGEQQKDMTGTGGC